MFDREFRPKPKREASARSDVNNGNATMSGESVSGCERELGMSLGHPESAEFSCLNQATAVGARGGCDFMVCRSFPNLVDNGSLGAR